MTVNTVYQQRHLKLLEHALGEDILAWMDDDDVIEIMLNPDGRLVLERLSSGKVMTGKVLMEEPAAQIIKLVASWQQEEVGSHNPIVSAVLPIKHARFQGLLSPVVSAPSFSIRKRCSQVFSLDDLLQQGAITSRVKDMLERAIADKKNIIIAGGTSSGKTTFANALLAELDNTDDRVLILEDLPELQVMAEDKIQMVTTDTVGMRDLVKNSLRLRPDRIIIGEVRDGAALELLKAWNTGHPGGVCTLHANSIGSIVSRIEDLLLEVVATVPQRLIAEAVDVLVYLAKDKNAKRCVTGLAQLSLDADNHYQLEDLLA